MPHRTTADTTIGSETSAGRRPRPGAGIRAELTETPDGWVLALHCDQATAAALRSTGLGRGGLDRFTVSVNPNLVPGEPFAIDTVIVVVDEHQDSGAGTAAGRSQQTRGVSGLNTRGGRGAVAEPEQS